MARRSDAPTPKRRRQGQHPADASWKPLFLEALAALGNVSAAARTAGVHKDTAYEHRKTDAEFARGWTSAVDTAVDLLEQEAWRRATVGTKLVKRSTRTMPNGEVVVEESEEHRVSDTLLIFLLKANRPEKYRERYDVNGTLAGRDGEPLTIRLAFDPTPMEAPAVNGGALSVKMGELEAGS